MRILHILFQFPGETGSGVFINNLIREFSKKEYTLGLVAAVGADMSYENRDLEFMDLVRFETEELPFSIPGMSDLMPYKSSKYGDMSQEQIILWKDGFKKSINRALKDFKPDIILANHLWIGTAMLEELYPGKRIMAICHSTDIRQLQQNPGYSEYVLEGCNKLDHIFALNQGQKEQITRFYGIPEEKISVAGGGFDSEIFNTISREEHSRPIRLIYAGKLSRSKGLLPLIEAYRRLSAGLDIELSFAGSGSGDEADEIISAAEKAGVNILGLVPQEVLGRLFKDSDIFVLPSYYEGLPLVLLEALACGLPAVVSDIKGLKDYLGDSVVNSGLVDLVPLPNMLSTDVPDSTSIEKFTYDLTESIKKQIRLLKEGYINFAPLKEVLEDLSWERVVERIEEFLK